jgi:POT family proton-dependent oligopeptide transporter
MAGAIYGLYTSMVYLAGVPGGWLADRILGQRRSVLYGGILIAAGHFTIALDSLPTFYSGLGLIVLGTGLLKPNISAMVGQLYRPGDNKRDAGFTIFYMGINLGAMFGPLVCGWLAEKVAWHYGFGVSGLGMLLGIVVYVVFGRVLKHVGSKPQPSDPVEARATRKKALMGGAAIGLGVVALVALVSAGWWTLVGVSNAFGVVLVGLAAVFFGWIFISFSWTPAERNRLIIIAVLFVGATIFWAGYEQSGSSLTLFADEHTNRMLGDEEFPTSWFQSVPAFYVLVLSLVFAVLWTTLGRRQPGYVAKFALGLGFLGAGFAVMIVAATRVADGGQVGPGWLLGAYFLHVLGEMCLSPIGLAAVTQLAPRRVTSTMMGAWFLASSVGSYFAGRAAGLYESLSLPALFGLSAAVAVVVGLILVALIRPTRRLLDHSD